MYRRTRTDVHIQAYARFREVTYFSGDLKFLTRANNKNTHVTHVRRCRRGVLPSMWLLSSRVKAPPPMKEKNAKQLLYEACPMHTHFHLLAYLQLSVHFLRANPLLYGSLVRFLVVRGCATHATDIALSFSL